MRAPCAFDQYNYGNIKCILIPLCSLLNDMVYMKTDHSPDKINDYKLFRFLQHRIAPSLTGNLECKSKARFVFVALFDAENSHC